MPTDSCEQLQRRATYITLTSLFLTVFAIIGRREQQSGRMLNLSIAEVVLLGLAVFRGGRLIAWDHVTEPLRAPFTQTVPDVSGAGDTVEPRGTGSRKALGELLSCPICSGTWVAGALIYGLRLFPGPARLLLGILGAAGAAELLNAAAEAMSWHAAAERQRAGNLMRDRQEC